MANNGTKINPQVRQYFTSGPNSGSEVSNSFNITFDVGTSTTSSMLCGSQFNYKIFNPQECEIPSYCITPTIDLVEPRFCGPDYNYSYRIKYLLNTTATSAPSTIIQYSLQSSFTGEVKQTTVTNNISSSQTEANININNLNTLPTNGNTVIYFRAINSCIGSPTSSSYSNIKSTKCEYIPPPPDYDILLLFADPWEEVACLGSEDPMALCQYRGPSLRTFCGNVYYSDRTNLEDATKIYTYTNPPVLVMVPGWYSNGSIARYWNGIMFVDDITCNPPENPTEFTPLN